MQIFEKVESLFESSREKKASMRRQSSHKELESCDLRHSMLSIGLQHGQLINVCEKRTFEWIDHEERRARVRALAPDRFISSLACRPSSGFTSTAWTASTRRKTW